MARTRVFICNEYGEVILCTSVTADQGAGY
jgi:hypothetical protein